MSFCQGILAVWDIESFSTRTGDPNDGNRGAAKQELTREGTTDGACGRQI